MLSLLKKSVLISPFSDYDGGFFNFKNTNDQILLFFHIYFDPYSTM